MDEIGSPIEPLYSGMSTGLMVARHVVPGLRELGFGGTEDPVLGEDRLDIEVEECAVGVEGGVEGEAHGSALDQCLDVH